MANSNPRWHSPLSQLEGTAVLPPWGWGKDLMSAGPEGCTELGKEWMSSLLRQEPAVTYDRLLSQPDSSLFPTPHPLTVDVLPHEGDSRSSPRLWKEANYPEI